MSAFKTCKPIMRAAALAAALALSAAPAPAATPRDQLVIGMNMNNLLSLDPAGATGNDVLGVVANLYDYLVELDPHDLSQVKPALAERWEIAPDNGSLTLTLREGVRFQSGRPLTAADAAWSLHRVLKLNLAMASPWKSYGFSAANAQRLIQAVDERTLRIALPEPTDPKMVLYTLGTSVSAAILDRQAVMAHEKNGDMGAAWLLTHAAGSGPYALTEWRAKDAMLLDRHDGYWRGPAKLRRVVMRHVPESLSLRFMISRGDVDLAAGMAGPDIEALKHDAAVEVQPVLRGTSYYVAVSMKDPKFADKRVRLALRSLIDYEGINKAIMPHYGVAHQRPVMIGLAATLPDPGYRLDVAAAKKLLAAAGYPNGFSTNIKVLSDPPMINIATALQATLALAGIQASVQSGTGNQVYGAMRDRKFEIVVGRGGGGVEPHPHANLRALVYNPDNRDAAKLTNFQGWRTSFHSPEINRLIEQAVRERDPLAQTAMYRQVQQLYDAEVGAIQPISQMLETVVLSKRVHGYVGHPSATTHLRGVYKD
ncbi:ABC transporter substrate-binding protein [Pseudoduganella namucuonensis]|uniref:Peptide/nickel transport system substrate-binding protein n=1 Tax=Pseudoduganella namucuonensis TaxID=1035707 RepID=A0A1I7F5K3_9BURK|nr:ABC transporter substrate-binding protein [Pseudoduganella namucuonensis]SFU31434.1 peptide/nickel transport system substrate-binding protein [Pseudoduganella namucuonensis]